MSGRLKIKIEKPRRNEFGNLVKQIIMHLNVTALLDREYVAQKSEEWLALRGKMLTASDAAMALGVNNYETPSELLLKKCGLGETG